MDFVPRRPPNAFRIYAIIFAAVLGVQAAWLLSAEFFRASFAFFPATTTEIQDAFAQRGRAADAAKIGWPRGDLWADYALSTDSRSLNDALSPSANDKGELVSERALATAPYDARLWLLVSASNARSGWKDDKTLAQLKMSYYTASNDTRLMPLRMAVAMQPQAIGDEELRPLVAHEIRMIITRKPDLKPIIATAYRGTSAAGRQFIEEELATLDSKFLAELRTVSH